MADSERAMKHDLRVVRWLRSGDFEKLLALDTAIFEHSWGRSTLNEIVNVRANLCAVAVSPAGLLLGYIIFEVQANSIYILKMGVSEEARRDHVGTELLQFVTSRLVPGRTSIEVDVRESLALEGHGFFKKHGFEATGVNRDFFKVLAEDADDPLHVEDSYNFVLKVPVEALAEDLTFEEAGCRGGDFLAT